MKYNPLFTHQSKDFVTFYSYFWHPYNVICYCTWMSVCVYVCLLGFYMRMRVFFWRFDRDDLPQVASSAREAQSELLALILLHSMWGRHSLFGKEDRKRCIKDRSERFVYKQVCRSSLSSYQFIQIRECFCVKKSIASTHTAQKYPLKNGTVYCINMKEFSVFPYSFFNFFVATSASQVPKEMIRLITCTPQTHCKLYICIVDRN